MPDGLPDRYDADKVATLRNSFYEFLEYVVVNSKNEGAGMRLADRIYRAQHTLYETVFDALAEGIHHIVVLKSRQLGISTALRPLMTFWAGVHEGLQGAMVYDTPFNTARARREVVEIIRALPPRLHFPGIIQDSREVIILEGSGPGGSGGSQIMLMAAGVKNARSGGGLGRSVGLNFAHCSELSSWVNEEGFISFRQSLSDSYPDRLYIDESTARGYELFYRHWQRALSDEFGSKTLFLGWWSHDQQVLERGTAEFAKYGAEPPAPGEVARMNAVYSLYGWRITQEQLAWYRKRTDPALEHEDGDEEDANLLQEQPWCVVGSTRVGTGMGILPISEVLPGYGATLCEVVHAGPTGRAPIWRAETALGYVVEGTANHPLIGVDGGEIEISNSRGALVKLLPPRFAKGSLYEVRWRDGVTECSIEITANLARLVGIYMGDGSLAGGGRSAEIQCTMQIVCDFKDRDFADECHRLIRSLFGIETTETRHDPHGTGGWIAVKANSKMLVTTFKRLGLSRDDTVATRRKVHVPEFIWRSPKLVVKEFLSGLFETDGFNGYETNRCVLFTKHEQFSRDIQLLLLGFGITCRRRTAVKRSGAGGEYIGYELHLRAAEARKFNDDIGFLSARKRGRAIKPERQKNGRRGRTVMPIVFADEVASASDTGRVEEVYNLSVTGDHWFDANGIVTHNTESEAFQMTGSSFFQSDKLTEATAWAMAQPKPQVFRFMPGIDFVGCEIFPARTRRESELRVWEEPVSDSVYVVSGDPAFGHSEWNNNSAAQVLRCYADGVDQVAEYATATIDPLQFSWLLWTLVGYYGSKTNSKVVVIIELNGPGEEVWRSFDKVRVIVQQGYLRSRAREKGLTDIFNNVRNYVYQRSDSMNAGQNMHWKTNAQLKEQIMTACRDYWHNGILRVRSLDAIEEARIVRRDGATIGAPDRDRDDRIFALAMGVRAWDEKLRRSLITGNRTREAERARVSVSIEDQYALWQKNNLSMFFANKENTRMALARQAMRDRRRAPVRRRW